MFKKLEFGEEKKQIDKDNINKNVSYINDYKNLKQVATNTNTTLKLHEEQLDIMKKWVQTANVDIHKEVSTEEKTLLVPVTREELVIEKKPLDGEAKENTEVIRIPIREEQIDVTKHWVNLEDVQVHKHQFQENKCIEETLKREKLHIDTTGNARVKNIETENPS